MLQHILTGGLAGLGVYLICADVLGLPHDATRTAAQALVTANHTSQIQRWLEQLAHCLAKHMPMNPFARAQLEVDLFSAGDSSTPEEYKASAVVKALVVGVLAVPMAALVPILTPVVLALAVYQYRSHMKRLHLRLKERRSKLEYELPKLVYHMEKHLKHSRDVLGMLEAYAQHAGPELQQELNITTADMRSGNYEAALSRLEARVGSAQMSDVCRGLISALRGDETSVYWSGLAVKFSEIQRQQLRLQAQKMPQKVKWLSMSLLCCFVLVYIVVILSQIMDSLGMIFG